jgi:hypothetical protein
VRGHNFIRFLVLGAVALSLTVVVPNRAMAYVGPGSGLEMLPQFLMLLAWAGAAFLAVLLWPITTLLRFLRRGKQMPQLETPNSVANTHESSSAIDRGPLVLQQPQVESMAVQQHGVME